jgi:hypothetical protein
MGHGIRIADSRSSTYIKHQIMRSLLYIIAVILIIGWAIGTFAYAAGSLIHILLVIAIIALVLGFLRRDTTAV